MRPVLSSFGGVRFQNHFEIVMLGAWCKSDTEPPSAAPWLREQLTRSVQPQLYLALKVQVPKYKLPTQNDNYES